MIRRSESAALALALPTLFALPALAHVGADTAEAGAAAETVCVKRGTGVADADHRAAGVERRR